MNKMLLQILCKSYVWNDLAFSAPPGICWHYDC